MSVEAFLESKDKAWAFSTISSARHKLAKLADPVKKADPEAAWVAIETLSPYTRSSYWHIAVSYYEFLNPDKPNVFKKWRSYNAKVFKNVYEKKQPTISYDSALQAISRISDKEVMEEAKVILETGIRISERFQITQDGYVKGKGGKLRKLFCSKMPNTQISNYRIREALKEVGLRPHDLRKVRATDLSRRGMKEADLCKVFGWNSFDTASSYIAPMNDDKIKEMMKA